MPSLTAPLALLAVCASALCVAGRWLSSDDARDGANTSEGSPSSDAALFARGALALALALASLVALTTLLGALHALVPWVTLASTALLALAGTLLAGRSARTGALRDARALAAALREALTAGSAAPLAWAGLLAALVALAAVYLLEPWAWDALGYHLPLVYDALATRTLREVPSPIEYINAYPHSTDVFTLWWRLLLPDDRWIEATQLPYGALGVLALATLATRAGVARGRALAVALGWLAVPAVALQLACNYVDVAFAAWCLAAAALMAGPCAPRELVASALCIALLLATKPSAPVAGVVLLLALALRTRASVRSGRAPRPPAWALALAAALLLAGASTYLANLLRYGNPLWPVRLRAGPLALPGKVDAGYFFNLGLPAALRGRGWLGRLLVSWFAQPDRYIYDMRAGGLGLAFAYVALPVCALGALARERRALLAAGAPSLVAFVATLATPGAFWPRYTLAAPGAALVLAALVLERRAPRVRNAGLLALSLATLAGLWLARGGFTDNGPSLVAVARRSPEERATSVGIDANTARWRALRAEVAPGEAAVYELGFGLPGLLWAPHARGRVEYLGERLRDADALYAWLRARRVRVALLCSIPEGDTRALARSSPERFAPQFDVGYDPCTAFIVRRDTTTNPTH